MSQENVKVVREMYDAMNRGDWKAVFAHASPEIEWETDPRHPKAGIYRGQEMFQRFVEDLEGPFEQSVIEPERFFARADQVVAFIKIRRKPMGSTAKVEIQIGELWTFRDGQLVRGQGFGEREQALKAAGLSEQDAHADYF
jgi:ketosteroid isomerase-like protein